LKLFCVPGGAERLRRVNRQGGRFSKKGGPEARSRTLRAVGQFPSPPGNFY